MLRHFALYDDYFTPLVYLFLHFLRFAADIFRRVSSLVTVIITPRLADAMSRHTTMPLAEPGPRRLPFSADTATPCQHFRRHTRRHAALPHTAAAAEVDISS